MSLKSLGKFLYENKQALINIVGMSMVFSYSVHNYRVKIAWEEREVEYRKLERELIRIKTGLVHDTWLDQTSEGITQGLKQPRLYTKTISEILRQEVDKVLNPLTLSKEQEVTEKIKNSKSSVIGTSDSTNAELGGLIGSIVTGNDGKPGGRVI